MRRNTNCRGACVLVSTCWKIIICVSRSGDKRGNEEGQSFRDAQYD